MMVILNPEDLKEELKRLMEAKAIKIKKKIINFKKEAKETEGTEEIEEIEETEETLVMMRN